MGASKPLLTGSENEEQDETDDQGGNEGSFAVLSTTVVGQAEWQRAHH